MKRILSCLIFALLLTNMLNGIFHIQLIKADPTTITVPDNYPTIQDAINHANMSDIILIKANTYYEHVIVNKTVTLIGEDKNTTIIDGNKTGVVVTVEANNVRISGFTIRNSGNTTENYKYPIDCGIKLYASSPTFQNVTIENNVIMNNSPGVYFRFSNNNTVINNVFYNNTGPPFVVYIDPDDPLAWPPKVKASKTDMFLLVSNGSRLAHNKGVIRLYNASSNIVTNCSQVFLSYSHENVIANCSETILLLSSHKNKITHCTGEIKLRESNDNLIKSNWLSPSKSIEVPDQSVIDDVASERNVVVDNVLTNGSIYIGRMPQLPSNSNIIASNVLIGGGINIYGSHNVIKLNKVSKTLSAITAYFGFLFCENNTISQNEIMDSRIGISASSSDSKIESNIVGYNELGILTQASGNELINNTISNNSFGLFLSSNNRLRDNTMFGNNYSLVTPLYPYSSPLYNDIDISNTINGKPIYYLINQTNLDINPSTVPNIAYLGLINCNNITISDLTLTGNGDGLLLSYSTNCTIERNTLKNNLIGISAYASNSSFYDNVISENYHGMTVTADYNKITNNTITGNTFRLSPYHWPESFPYFHPIREWITDYLMWYSGGMFLWHANNNTFVGNNITDNERGVFLYMSGSNIFKNNSMEGNVYNFGIDSDRLFPYEWIIHPPETPQISPYLINDIDMSNTVNGKPIYWWMNRHNEQVPIDAGYVALINSTNMIVRDLVLQNNTQGILLVDVNNTVVSHNIVTGSRYGIVVTSTYLKNSFGNTITNNNITTNGVGLYLIAANNTATFNLINKNLAGIFARGDFNLILGNTIMNNVLPPHEEWILGYEPVHLVPQVVYFYPGAFGILFDSANNTVCYNTLQNNDYGVGTGYVTGKCENNRIYHNNFINNTWQAFVGPVSNWDDGYPSGGNYWSDYNDTDSYHGQYQNQTGSDGIGDSPYYVGQWLSPFLRLPPEQRAILMNQYDHYPLMAPINILDIGTWYGTGWNISVVSNSMVSGVHFNPNEGAMIRFNVTGENGTDGFCRVAIPKNLLWVDDGWTIQVGDNEIKNYTVMQDEKCTYLYFSYNHSTKTVNIIGTHVVPEFSSTIVIPLFMIVIMPTIILLKKKFFRKSHC